MDVDKQRFGDYIKAKRMDSVITVRDMAERIGVSPAYLSDIENNRRYPMDNEKIEKLAIELKLLPKEKEFLYDLAGNERKEVSLDLPEYIMDSEVAPYVRMALRKAKKSEATIEDWKRFMDQLDRKDND